MSGGGGGSQAPVAPVYTDPVNGQSFNDAQSLNDEIRSRQQQETDASSLAAANAATDAANQAKQKESDDYNARLAFGDRFNQARNGAQSDILNYFKNMGYDPSQYGEQINRTLDRQSANVADLAANPSASFSPTAGADLVNSLQSGLRTQATSKINSAFSPTYADTAISNDWLQPASDALLKQQFDPLGEQLQNAQKRGTLNDAGYGAALNALSGKRTAAQSTLSSLGGNILGSDRAGLNDYITGAKNDAAGVDLNTGANFSADPYLAGASKLTEGYKNSFAGDLSNAVGDTAFADIGSLLNAGGSVQGAIDPNATGGAASGKAGAGISDAYLAQQALAAQKRGIGTQGGF